MKTVAALMLASGLLSGCFGVDPDAPVPEPSDAKIASTMSREELEKENVALKRENQRLRRELVRQKMGEPQVDLSKVREQKGVAGEETNGKATDDGGYWLTDEKLRRHNSKCKYYKMGRGRPCKKDEGTACKRCGG